MWFPYLSPHLLIEVYHLPKGIDCENWGAFATLENQDIGLSSPHAFWDEAHSVPLILVVLIVFWLKRSVLPLVLIIVGVQRRQVNKGGSHDNYQRYAKPKRRYGAPEAKDFL